VTDLLWQLGVVDGNRKKSSVSGSGTVDRRS